MKDHEIIALFWERSEKAISEMTRQYGKLLYRIIFNLLGDPQDSEECLNDTWITLWNSIPPQKPDNLKVYSGKVARNIALNRWQKNTAQKRNTNLTTMLSELDDCIPDRSHIGDELNYTELVGMINTYLSRLNDQKQALFVQRYWYGETVAQIARQYGLPEQTVSSMLFRIRAGLKNYLNKQGVYI